MKSYSQPEGEEVSDARDRQEGMSEFPPLNREKKGWRRDGGWRGREMKKTRKSFCCTELQTRRLWVYFLYPGTPRVLRSELAPFAYLEDRSPELYLPKPSFLLFVGMVPWDTGR